MKTYFTVSNIYRHWCDCNIVYCRDYHVIAITIFYDAALFWERRITDRRKSETGGKEQ